MRFSGEERAVSLHHMQDWFRMWVFDSVFCLVESMGGTGDHSAQVFVAHVVTFLSTRDRGRIDCFVCVWLCSGRKTSVIMLTYG